MKRNEDISTLITNKTFRKILADWNGYNESTKNKICRDYSLNLKDVEILRHLWLAPALKKVKLPRIAIEQALQETIWKLAERRNIFKKPKSKQYDKPFAKLQPY